MAKAPSTCVFLDTNVIAKPVTRTLLMAGGPLRDFHVTWSLTAGTIDGNARYRDAFRLGDLKKQSVRRAHRAPSRSLMAYPLDSNVFIEARLINAEATLAGNRLG